MPAAVRAAHPPLRSLCSCRPRFVVGLLWVQEHLSWPSGRSSLPWGCRHRCSGAHSLSSSWWWWPLCNTVWARMKLKEKRIYWIKVTIFFGNFSLLFATCYQNAWEFKRIHNILRNYLSNSPFQTWTRNCLKWTVFGSFCHMICLLTSEILEQELAPIAFYRSARSLSGGLTKWLCPVGMLMLESD